MAAGAPRRRQNLTYAIAVMVFVRLLQRLGVRGDADLVVLFLRGFARSTPGPTIQALRKTHGEWRIAVNVAMLRQTRIIMRKLALLLGILALTHCAAEKAVYLRTDGQDVAGNAALRQQLELDRTTCQGEPGDEQDCMAIKGYVSVNKDKAAAKQQQLATIAAQRAANDRAIAVPPPPSATPDKTAKAKKPKSKPPESSLRSSQD